MVALQLSRKVTRLSRKVTSFSRSPSNVSELRSFLGLVNFVTKFVSHSADLLMPLNNLLKKDVKFIWSSAQQKSFESIKKAVCESTILSYYNPNLELVLENDASEYGLGSALFQNGKPITFASRALSASEKKLRTDRKGNVGYFVRT